MATERSFEAGGVTNGVGAEQRLRNRRLQHKSDDSSELLIELVVHNGESDSIGARPDALADKGQRPCKTSYVAARHRKKD